MGANQCSCDFDLNKNSNNQQSIQIKPQQQCIKTIPRNRINSIINPNKLPKLQLPIYDSFLSSRDYKSQGQYKQNIPVSAAVTPATLRFQLQTASSNQHSLNQANTGVIDFTVDPANMTEYRFQFGAHPSVSPNYRVQASTPDDEFKLSIYYLDTYSQGYSFFLRDQAVGLGCFYKIPCPSTKIQLVPNMLISIGNQFVVPCFVKNQPDRLASTSQQSAEKTDNNTLYQSKTLLETGQAEDQDATTTIHLKVYGGCAENQSLDLSSFLNQVTIGRSEICSLSIGDCLLSKVQLTLKRCLETNKWYLSDGDGKSTSSKNGTWVYLGNSAKVFNGMQVRCASKYYKLQLIR